MTALSRNDLDLGWLASFFDRDSRDCPRVGEIADVAIHVIDSPKHPFCAVTTVGLASQSIAVIHRQELFTTVRREQWQGAQFLLQFVLEGVLERGAGLNYGDIVGNDVPVLNGTSIHGVLADPTPELPEEANTRLTMAGAIETNFMHLVPLTIRELEVLSSGSRDDQINALDVAFDELGVDTTDLRRASAVR
jgi:hypothetical protein